MGKKAVRSSTTVIVKALRNGGLGKTYELPIPATVADLKDKMQADPHTYDIVDGVGKAASEYQIYQKPAKDAPKDAPKVELQNDMQFEWQREAHEVVFYGGVPTVRSMKCQDLEVAENDEGVTMISLGDTQHFVMLTFNTAEQARAAFTLNAGEYDTAAGIETFLKNRDANLAAAAKKKTVTSVKKENEMLQKELAALRAQAKAQASSSSSAAAPSSATPAAPPADTPAAPPADDDDYESIVVKLDDQPAPKAKAEGKQRPKK